MSSQYVLCSIAGGVATITLDRPDVHNAFNEEVIGQLSLAFTQIEADEAVRAVVLRGNGKSFCAGGDLSWMRRVADYSHEENVADAMQLGHLLYKIDTLQKPVIALIHGAAFGGGVGLAACCDIAIAEEGAQFCLSEVRIGLIPSIIAPYVLKAMGERQARRYFLTAERFDAVTAHRIGFIHEVAPKGQLDAAAEKILNALFEGAPAAQAMGKTLIHEIAQRPVDAEIVALTSTRIAEARASAEGRAGLTAFLEKKDPPWRKK